MRKVINKITGELGQLHESSIRGDEILVFPDTPGSPNAIAVYDSLDKLAAEWEDYEEPKGFWMINTLGVVEYTHDLPESEVEMMKEIGNHFETEEEAKKAVEKLKAWKRLKDKGLRLMYVPEDYETGRPRIDCEFGKNYIEHTKIMNGETRTDLELLFGDEE